MSNPISFLPFDEIILHILLILTVTNYMNKLQAEPNYSHRICLFVHVVAIFLLVERFMFYILCVCV